MDHQAIENLRAALRESPHNIPLKRMLAETLLRAGHLDEAEQEYSELLAVSEEDSYKTALARIFFARGEYSKCNVLLEALLNSNYDDMDTRLLHAKALLREQQPEAAREAYRKVLELDPGFTDEELDQALRLPAASDDLLDEILGDDNLIFKPEINFDDVGGMEGVKKEIDLKIVKPLQHPELYKAYGKKTGGGILLYGPPGCGKTFIARATAGQINNLFLSVGLEDILDMWVGSSEKNLHHIFETARDNKPCVLFIDEIDALGASRNDMRHSAGRQLINQFLMELDGVEYNNDGMLVLGATNAPWHLDAAFRRPGRFDRIIFVPPPDEAARQAIFRLKLKDKPAENIDFQQLAKKTEHYSGADIEAVIDLAVEEKLTDAFQTGQIQALRTKDLLAAITKHKPSTSEWLATAKNYALFANNSGLYDDVLSYLKIKK